MAAYTLGGSRAVYEIERQLQAELFQAAPSARGYLRWVERLIQTADNERSLRESMYAAVPRWQPGSTGG